MTASRLRASSYSVAEGVTESKAVDVTGPRGDLVGATARVLTTLLMVLRWATPEAVHVNMGLCLRLVHLASVSVCLPLSAHLSAISLKNSPLCDLILTKRVKRPKSILILSSSRISRRMFPSGDSLMVGSISSPIYFWIAIKRQLESVSKISGLLLPAYAIASSRAMHAAACSTLL